MHKLGHWVRDYFHAAAKQAESVLFRRPPSHYLGHVVHGKCPLILIPGVLEKWHFLHTIAEPLSKQGHPIYVLEHLGYNTRDIHKAAKLVRELIEERDLRDVVIIAHSKGGLIGKYVLAHENHDGRVRKVIAIAAPFHGSRIVHLAPVRFLRELGPSSEVVRRLHEAAHVNQHIISIYGAFDNHVWPEESCRLDGARNIQVVAHGHHAILSSAEVLEIVHKEVARI